MIEHSVELKYGFMLPLEDLKAKLAQMSSGTLQWVVVPIPDTVRMASGQIRSYVAIGFSNPHDAAHQNYLCYLFPLTTCDVPGAAMRSTVYLSPEAATPLSKGLYLEEGSLKFDVLEDWDRFWEPLKLGLGPATPVEFPDPPA